MRVFAVTTIVLTTVLAMLPHEAQADHIAYDNTGGQTGLQNYGNNLGLDFTVNAPVHITSLGAFDNGDAANLAGVVGSSGITVGIFNLSTMALAANTTTVHFSPTDAGTQINGDAFMTTHFDLQPGNYAVVAFNDGNTNTNGGAERDQHRGHRQRIDHIHRHGPIQRHCHVAGISTESQWRTHESLRCGDLSILSGA